MSESQPCMLYYDPRSICSSMVRYTIANTGAPSKGALPLAVELHHIDIFKSDQLSEFYLCEVNPKRPVLSSEGYLETPITDSLDITLWLCDRFPSLRPAEHADDVTKLLRELHAINFFTLSMRNTPQRATAQEDAIQTRLSASDLSEKHREALKYKQKVTRSQKTDGLKPEIIKAEIERARALLAEINNHRSSNAGMSDEAWVFGTPEPTALDTTLICFLARLMDVKLEEIIPAPLLELARKIRATPQFKEIWTSLPGM